MSSKNFYGLTGDVTVDGGILNVGNAQLYANTETSNVGIGTSNPEFELDIRGDANVENLYATYLHGDGSNIENIVSSQWEGSPGDPIYYTSNVGIANTSPVTKTLQVGSNLYVEDEGSNVLHVTGNIYADKFVGDGSQLTGIAASLDQIVDQGNTVSNTIQIVSGQDATSNIGLVTHDGVGISISNTNPTGEFQFGVGSNLLVNVNSSNVLTVDGNVFAQKMTLGTVTVTPAYNLQQIMATGATSDQTLVLSNVTTGLTTTSNVGIANTAPVHTLDVGSNLYVEDTGSNVLTVTGNVSVSNLQVTERLDVGSNLHIENLRVAEVAANLVTYDSATGELMDSAGLFSNKLAVVSEQPPVALTGASTVVEKHGTYTIEASSTATGSEVYHLFDKVSGETNKWVTDGNYSTVGETKGDYNGSANLTGEDNPTGEWVKITMPYKTILRHVKIESTNQSVEDIKLVGLNSDGLTWSVLKTVTGLTGTTHTIIVNATTHHKTYGLIVEKTNTTTGRSAVEIGDLKLFTESFSIDGGKVEMATSMVMGGETTMDQHGPHGRGVAPLKKYPEIVFEEGKFDYNVLTNTYTQAGYTVTASSQYPTSGLDNYDPSAAFGPTPQRSTETGWHTLARYNSDGTYPRSGNIEETLGGYSGEWIKLESPNKFKLDNVQILPRKPSTSNWYETYSPLQFRVLGSNNDTNWNELLNVTNAVVDGAWTFSYKTFEVNATEYYKYYALSVYKINGASTYLFISDIRYNGYEELATEGDTSIDTTFTSIMNTPQTTGANVYVDAKLSSDFTNQVTGPDATGPSATYDETGKYWELNGTLTSNIAVEANTFLEGDQPHSVSVWFNSSNLEANVSNTCVFSISDQEKLDSVNLDLQSNTWHNLTYAYQGEGGSRVTYLDGRKVAEDQAEDTFGDYPPFAMTGYSQGGYVVSASYDNTAISREAWKAFDDDTSSIFDTSGGAFSSGQPGLAASTGSFPGEEITLTDGTTHTRGQWLQLEFPFKFVVSSYYQRADTNDRQPQNVSLLGSNDNTSWHIIKDEHTLPTQSENTIAVNTTNGYKYLRYVIHAIVGSDDRAVINEFKYYGHRENDLVRLPDPTNVLKYPHIAMTTETTSVQGPKINPGAPGDRGYEIIYSNHGGVPELPSRAFDGNTDATVGSYGWLTSGYTYDVSSGSFPGTSGASYSLTIDGTSRNGAWIGIKMLRKLKVSSVVYWPRYGNGWEIQNGYIVGSNDGISWDSLLTISGETGWTAEPKTFTMNNNLDNYYQYFAILATQVQANNTVGRFAIHELEFYGTEEATPIPIQIGGGNIDKVANFRVYDKFIGEDQALEIWDAQKDEFGRAKSSMTLHKGRLGIGTTEPEGRLAVADEPDPDTYGLQRIPPKPASGYDTYIDGYGIFQVSTSNADGDTAAAYWAFDHDIDRNTNSWRNSGSPYTSGTWNSTDSASTVENSNTHVGHWIQLYTPVKYSLKSHKVSARGVATYRQPYSAVVLGSTDGSTWNLLDTWTTTDVNRVKRSITIDNTTLYSYFRLVVKALENNGDAVRVDLGEWELYGIREQVTKQSVLHDGQLTLTKSLNVPRIGPALDADDTPRRDRLVVEYNTSTNPTFEGAVRDTSGRGNDGVFYGGASYDANEKALVFDGVDDFTEVDLGKEVFKNSSLHTTSLWVKMNEHSSDFKHFFSLGNGLDNPDGNLAHINFYHSTNHGLRLSFTQHDYRLGEVVPIGQWVHVAYTYDGTTWQNTTTPTNVNIYINGVKVDVTSVYQIGGGGGSGLDLSTAKLGLGARTGLAQGQNFTQCDLSQFKLYDTALTAEEVKTLYDMGRTGHIVNPQPLHIAAPLQVEKTLRVPVDNTNTGTYTQGMIRYNTDYSKLQVYNGSAWITLGGISAIGGTVTYADGYTIHTFTDSGTFTLNSGGDIEYLVVAGGGGGGIAHGTNGCGGGGAGGMLTGTYTTLAPGTYSITSGGGGAGSSTNLTTGGDGSPSSISDLVVAKGGGGGGAGGNGDGRSGGSGGGAATYNNNTPDTEARNGGSGENGQGNDGRSTNGLLEYGGGGGGGAGATGGAIPVGGVGGAGGNGVTSSISGTSTFYAGGGGGTGWEASAAGSGGSGGGGAGGTRGSNATYGTDGLGGGGGAAKSGNRSGNGGSGIVIIRYLS